MNLALMLYGSFAFSFLVILHSEVHQSQDVNSLYLIFFLEENSLYISYVIQIVNCLWD